MRPRHADLLAEDLDLDTVIKYVDRFFMFYIRTADRLQRTSVWMENLEGGLDYLQSVIIDDKLGICEQLNEMAYIVDTYECEWKKAVETPEIRARFRHFNPTIPTRTCSLLTNAVKFVQPAPEKAVLTKRERLSDQR